MDKKYNNANILCLPGRFFSPPESIEVLKSFLYSEFQGGRHQKRLDKVAV
ncbi:hypothetical protein GM418_25940 [Maribellus comscasis]|uniref:Ribose-5-phosphate isomerase n=1 Tax=Maribellus comscasis TaxID=2681766 RepID=A0A6I6K353_9BACT|nr:hypothetical protein GM418_25940 [Maribellus comscasis]